MGRNLEKFKGNKLLDFRNEESLLDAGLIQQLKKFEEAIKEVGGTVYVSPAEGSLYRESTTSQHGKGLAADVMVKDISLWDAYLVARKVGFHGIGLYPDWEPDNGLHLDMRTDRTSEDPALWSGFNINGKQKYFDINLVLLNE